MEAFVHGVSARKVDDLVQALGIDTGVSKSQVSRICAELDGVVGEFRDRRLDHVEFPYVFLDATYVKAHDGAHVVSKAIVVATGVAADGHPRCSAWPSATPRTPPSGPPSCAHCAPRGLGGVRLVISDAHQGLRSVIDRVLTGVAWQRCRVHFLRNVLARVPKGSAETVAAAIRTIFAQPDAAAVHDQLVSIADKLAASSRPSPSCFMTPKPICAAFAAFPQAHWRKIWSTNPLERVNKEIKRRSTVEGIFPNQAAVVRLTGAVLLEVHDEWQIAERRYLSEASMAHLAATSQDDPTGKETSDHHELLAG